ncbi:hypothetical protein [Amycolatopsis pithecellobii]|uniref:hypothetical protein n=1 Tax=Amycolatopsis pithecellobii TaxID=664692 RepID=UPI001AA045B8|nr:hypothetical protein [Amycolatopsis pithecellobii]
MVGDAGNGGTTTSPAAARHVDDDVLAHISPAHSENVNFFGTIEVVIDAELAQLGPTGYRPLRAGDTLFWTSRSRPAWWGLWQ